MSNPRSASNAWAKIRVKLNAGIDVTATPATPKKGGGRKKAATPKADADNDDAGDATPKATPKATPRKRGPKKQDVDGEDSTPKKKRAPATPKAKKGAAEDAKKGAAEDAEEGADEDPSEYHHEGVGLGYTWGLIQRYPENYGYKVKQEEEEAGGENPVIDGAGDETEVV
jgi:hypothetical protein